MNKSYLINPLTELPFHDIGNDEFFKVTGAWVHSLPSNILECKDLFQDVIESPEKTLERENTPCGNYIESKYYTIKQAGLNLEKAAQKKGLSIFHYNMRSLAKSLMLLTDTIVRLKKVPGIIAISETKLNDDYHTGLLIF